MTGVELVDKGVLLTLRIDAEYKLLKSEVCQIGTGSLITGDSVLEFVQTEDVSPDLRQDKDYTTDGRVAKSPFQSLANVDIESTINSIRDAGDEFKRLASKVNALLEENGQTITNVLGNIETTLATFNDTMVDLRSTLNAVASPQNQENLRQSLEAMPQIAAAAQDTLVQMNQTLAAFKEVANEAQTILVNVSELAEAMRGQEGQEVLQSIADTLTNVQRLSANLARMSDSIDSKEGTVGLLIHDRELYDRVNRTLQEFEKATQKIPAILADVRIITDKLARDPGQVGVRSLLDRRPPGSGQKFPIYQNSAAPEYPSNTERQMR